MAIGNAASIFDIQSTVSQIIEFERQQKIDPLTAKKESYEKAQEAYSEVDSSLELLQAKLGVLMKASTFQSRIGQSSDSDVATATSSTNAAEAVYNLSNITLAQKAKITSGAVLGLSTGSAATLQSTAEIITGGGTLDPNKRFNDGITLDPGESISAGSFKVNGKTIDVEADDTVNLVISKINSSGAGVTASFDDATDLITLTYDETGSVYNITLEDDTSGFLSAMKLDGATQTDGVNHDLYRNLDDTTLVSAGTLQDGFFTINGITFEVETSSDTLNEIISRVNSSAAGVTLFYDEETDKVTMTSKEDGEDIVMENDTSNFLTELNILDVAGEDTDGTAGRSVYEGTDATVDINGETVTRDSNTFTINGTTITLRSAGTATISVELDKDKIQTAIQEFVDQYNETNELMLAKMENGEALDNDRTVRTLQRSLKQKLYSSVSNPGAYTTLSQIGVKLNSSGDLTLDTDTLKTAVGSDPDDVFKLFAYDSNEDGLYDDGGFAVSTESWLENYTRSYSGFIDKKEDLYDTRIETLDRKIDEKEDDLADEEARLTQEYIELQNMLNRLQAQQAEMGSYMVNMDMITGQYLL